MPCASESYKPRLRAGLSGRLFQSPVHHVSGIFEIATKHMIYIKTPAFIVYKIDSAIGMLIRSSAPIQHAPRFRVFPRGRDFGCSAMHWGMAMK
jgi:hypothetical protein